MQTSAGAPAARRAANTQTVHRLRRLILSHRRARSAAAPSPHKILLRKLSWGPRPPEGRLIDFAPFKKPGRLAGLFSYRSVIPPSPHKILLCKLSWGPRLPCGRLIDFAPFKKPGRLAGLFSYRSVIPSRPKSRHLRGGWPRNAPAGAVLLPTKLCCANFRGGPGRPKGGLWTALYLKRPAVWLGVCHVTAFFNSDLWLSCARFPAAAFFRASRARPPTRQKTRGSERQREKHTAAPAEQGRR